MPGILTRTKMKFTGGTLPPATVPIETSKVCRAGAEGPIFVPHDQRRSQAHQDPPALRGTTSLTQVRTADGAATPLASASGGTVFMTSQGFQLVEMDWKGPVARDHLRRAGGVPPVVLVLRR
jgi:hypothetical protein